MPINDCSISCSVADRGWTWLAWQVDALAALLALLKTLPTVGTVAAAQIDTAPLAAAVSDDSGLDDAGAAVLLRDATSPSHAALAADYRPMLAQTATMQRVQAALRQRLAVDDQVRPRRRRAAAGGDSRCQGPTARR